MALTERSRSALYQGLTDLIEDEVAVGELLSYFPARDVEEPATKEFVAAEVAGVHQDIAELRVEMAAMGADLRAEMAAQLRTMIQWTVGLMISLIGLVVAMGILQSP